MRLASFILLFCIGLYLPFWMFVIAGGVYALFFNPLELCIIAVSIDAGFGDPERGIWFMYTLAVFFIIVSMMYIKPRLRFY